MLAAGQAQPIGLFFDDRRLFEGQRDAKSFTHELFREFVSDA